MGVLKLKKHTYQGAKLCMHACMCVETKATRAMHHVKRGQRPPLQGKVKAWGPPPPQETWLILSLLLSKWAAPILSLLLPPHVVKLSQVALATSLPKFKSLDPYMAAFSALKANNGQLVYLFKI